MSEDQVNPEQVGDQPGQENQQPPEAPRTAPVNIGDEKAKADRSNAPDDKKKRKRKPLSCGDIWAIVLGISGIIVAGVTGAAIIWQDILSSRTLAQAVEVQRPWVGMAGPIIITKITNGPPLRIEYMTKIKNFGGVPAFHVIPSVKALIGSANMAGIRQDINAACKRIDDDLLPANVGEIIFPGDDYSFPTEDSLSVTSNVTNQVYFFPGCITYLTDDGKIHHTTICQWTDRNTLQVGETLSSCSRQSAD